MRMYFIHTKYTRRCYIKRVKQTKTDVTKKITFVFAEGITGKFTKLQHSAIS
jgi:hypothetical protein